MLTHLKKSEISSNNEHGDAQIVFAECQDEETEYCDPSWSREFPRKPDIQYAPDIAAQLDRVGQIDPLPRKTVGWKKSRADRKKPEPLREKVAYITIYSHHHRNRDYGWIDVAILSEIDFWMQKEKRACFASMRHLAAVLCAGKDSGRLGQYTSRHRTSQPERLLRSQASLRRTRQPIPTNSRISRKSGSVP